MKTFQKILLIIFIFTISAVLVAIGYYFAVTKDAVLDESKLLLPKAQICAYDIHGERIEGGAGFSGRETVRLSELSKHTQNAFVCVEDKRFYSHQGFDIRSIARALFNNLKAGAFKEGASTISQQLIKNTHLSLEKTLRRKLKEIKLTRALERRYSKAEILELYLNTIYFGHSVYGVECASEFYFGKSASDLTVEEAALLAGLVRSPNNYSPFKNPEAAKRRRATVLSLMREQNKLTEKEYKRAMDAPLPTAKPTFSGERHYLRYALNELETLLTTLHLPMAGKIEAYTYLDAELQKRAVSLTEDVGSDAVIAVLDNEKLGLKAFYATSGEMRRSPASIIKPLAVYAPAFENGLLSPATPILDEPIDYGGYSPKNYDGKYRGFVSAREALSQSLNIPAVKTLNALGVASSAKFLRRLGLPTEKEDETLALALGGVSKGYTLTELLSAYAALANDGKFAPCAFLRKIVVNGYTVYEYTPNFTIVFSPETAYLTTNILQDCAQNGTAKKLRTLPFSIAAKTGTAGEHKDNTDAYALSYTPLDTVGVWLGNADNSLISATGGGKPTEISLRLHEEIKKARGNIPEFERPFAIKPCELDDYSYQMEHRLLLADESSPAKHRFLELFWEKYAPNERSQVFSSPRINTPKISVEDGGVRIILPEGAPEFYRYEITRTGADGKEIVYQGNLQGEYFDDKAKAGVSYEYAVTPFYEKRAGETIALPAVKTPVKIPKDWWRK